MEMEPSPYDMNNMYGSFAKPTKTLRDEFAMAALHGIMLKQFYPGHDHVGIRLPQNAQENAKQAYEQADAMLAAREGK